MFKNQKEVNAVSLQKAKGSRDWITDESVYGYLVDARIPEGATGTLFTMKTVTSQNNVPVLTGDEFTFWESVVLNNRENGKLFNIALGTLIGITCTGSYKAKSTGKPTTLFKVNVITDENGKDYTLSTPMEPHPQARTTKPTKGKKPAEDVDNFEIDWS